MRLVIPRIADGQQRALLLAAAEHVVTTRFASQPQLKRRLGCGDAAAAKLLRRLEAIGITCPIRGRTRVHHVLVPLHLQDSVLAVLAVELAPDPGTEGDAR